MRPLSTLLILIPLLLAPAMASSDCSPEGMVKITFLDATPGKAVGPATPPRTLYRLGSHYARLEEPLDREHGVHGLIVVNRRDTWMVNLLAGKGQHIVDSAEQFEFHAPIVGGPAGLFPAFEFGCELAWMKERGIAPERVTVDGRRLQRYETAEGNTTLRLLVDPQTETPLAVEFVEAGETLYFMRYVEYQTGLDPDMSLFEKPAGITFRRDEQSGRPAGREN